MEVNNVNNIAINIVINNVNKSFFTKQNIFLSFSRPERTWRQLTNATARFCLGEYFCNSSTPSTVLSYLIIIENQFSLWIHSNVVSECIDEKSVSTADADSLNTVSDSWKIIALSLALVQSWYYWLKYFESRLSSAVSRMSSSGLRKRSKNFFWICHLNCSKKHPQTHTICSPKAAKALGSMLKKLGGDDDDDDE